MTKLPLVGAHFRPPAKGLLQALPAGHPLELVPEPSNPHDPNAVMVRLVTASIPEDQQENIGTCVVGYGHDWDMIAQETHWHLGYVPRTEAPWLQPLLTEPFPCTLQFDGNGKPMVEFDLDSP